MSCIHMPVTLAPKTDPGFPKPIIFWTHPWKRSHRTAKGSRNCGAICYISRKNPWEGFVSTSISRSRGMDGTTIVAVQQRADETSLQSMRFAFWGKSKLHRLSLPHVNPSEARRHFRPFEDALHPIERSIILSKQLAIFLRGFCLNVLAIPIP